MADELAGQTAIVTGGGRGIGRAIALALSAAGAAVAVAARSRDEVEETVRLIAAAGGRGLALTADVTDRAAVEQMVAATEAALGPVELLVNNAGTHSSVGRVWEVDPGLWWRDLETNVLGVFLCARAVLPAMVARRRGRIVNISSGAALEPRPRSSAYAAAKTAALRLTESLAADVREFGVNVFAVHPGGVRTALTEAVMASAEGRAAYPQWAKLDWAPPERVAGVVVALASGRADALSGRFIDTAQDLDALAAAVRAGRDDLLTLQLVQPEPHPLPPGPEGSGDRARSRGFGGEID